MLLSSPSTGGLVAGLVAMSLLENAVFRKSGVVSGARFQKLKFRDEDDLPLPG